MTPETLAILKRLELVREAITIHLQGLTQALAEADRLAGQLVGTLEEDDL